MFDLPTPPSALLDGAALFLDFDGTLVELAETPDAILVRPDLAPMLGRLHHRLAGRVAIVSGRSVADLDRHLPEAGIAVSGSHGLELRLDGGSHVSPPAPPGLDEVRERVRRFAAARPGLLVENKPVGVALHYRRAPAEAVPVTAYMETVARDAGLMVQLGSQVVELRPAGADKGDALRAIMAHVPFVGARPVFLGDDLTDEHAFDAAARLGGDGILVGPNRATGAHYRLPSVAAVAQWLEAWA